MNPSLRSVCRGLKSIEMSRRHCLKVGGLGLLGLSLPRLLRAESAGAAAARARSVVFLYQFGGPSHLETFDLKPEAPREIRGPHRGIPTSVPGLEINEHLPRLAKVMDKVCLVRSVHHEMKNHNSASYYALTGHAPPLDDIRLRDSLELFPAYGSVVDRLAPPRPGLPGFVSFPHVIRDGSVTPGQRASFLGRAHDPFFVGEDPASPDFRLPELSLPANLSFERLRRRRALLELVDGQARLLERAATARGLDEHYKRALAMLESPHLRAAFDLAAEPERCRDLYGRHTYGQSLLLARRLVEHGVRFVTVYFSDTIGGQSTSSGGWDTHGFNNTRMYPIIEKRHLPITDETLPVFLVDLEQRGLLDSTLVIWMGEFGRTPRLNQNESRDHWPQCYTVLLAGGGLKRGCIYGASDGHGAYPALDPVRPEDLSATMFQLLGIDPTTEVHDASDRPLAISTGRPIAGVLA